MQPKPGLVGPASTRAYLEEEEGSEDGGDRGEDVGVGLLAVPLKTHDTVTGYCTAHMLD